MPDLFEEKEGGHRNGVSREMRSRTHGTRELMGYQIMWHLVVIIRTLTLTQREMESRKVIPSGLCFKKFTRSIRLRTDPRRVPESLALSTNYF